MFPLPPYGGKEPSPLGNIGAEVIRFGGSAAKIFQDMKREMWKAELEREKISGMDICKTLRSLQSFIFYKLAGFSSLNFSIYCPFFQGIQDNIPGSPLPLFNPVR